MSDPQQNSQGNDASQNQTNNQSLEDKIKALQEEENTKKEAFSEEQSTASQSQQDAKDAEIEKLKKELEEMKSIAMRATADYQNLRKRSEEEKQDFIKYANSKIILEILPFIDNMKRAMQHVPEELKSNEWTIGVLNIGTHMLDTLNKLGLSKIESIGQKLDPSLHEALMQMPGEKDLILQEMEEGYMLNGKVIRYAKVVVGNGEEVAKDN